MFGQQTKQELCLAFLSPPKLPKKEKPQKQNFCGFFGSRLFNSSFTGSPRCGLQRDRGCGNEPLGLCNKVYCFGKCQDIFADNTGHDSQMVVVVAVVEEHREEAVDPAPDLVDMELEVGRFPRRRRHCRRRHHV